MNSAAPTPCHRVSDSWKLLNAGQKTQNTSTATGMIKNSQTTGGTRSAPRARRVLVPAARSGTVAVAVTV
ncbi:hypothetical protein GCM10028864_50560 [Microlunatus parietis]